MQDYQESARTPRQITSLTTAVGTSGNVGTEALSPATTGRGITAGARLAAGGARKRPGTPSSLVVVGMSACSQRIKSYLS